MSPMVQAGEHPVRRAQAVRQLRSLRVQRAGVFAGSPWDPPPVRENPWSRSTRSCRTERRDDGAPPETGEPRLQTLSIDGSLRPEVWNRVGTKLLPKLRTGSNLVISVRFQVDLREDLQIMLRSDLEQILRDLGIENSLRIT